MSVAKVRVSSGQRGGTDFRVSGGGPLLTARAVNSLGIARRVAAAIEQAPELRADR